MLYILFCAFPTNLHCNKVVDISHGQLNYLATFSKAEKNSAISFSVDIGTSFTAELILNPSSLSHSFFTLNSQAEGVHFTHLSVGPGFPTI